jgi:hypothetical protein
MISEGRSPGETIRRPAQDGPLDRQGDRVEREGRSSELGADAGRAGSASSNYVAAQAHAAALVAAHCLELVHDDPLAAARRLRTTTFFGAFELDPEGLQRGHRLAVVRWRGGRRELLLADVA